MDVHRRNLRQKAEKGKFIGSEATTRFPQASCFEKPTAFYARNMGAHVQCTRSECQGYKKWDKKLDSRAAEKGAKKISK